MPKNEHLQELSSEPSLSEILSSIKQIIADDVQQKQPSEKKKQPSIKKASPEDNTEKDGQHDNEEILDLIDVYKEDKNSKENQEDESKDNKKNLNLKQKNKVEKENVEHIISEDIDDEELDTGIELDYEVDTLLDDKKNNTKDTQIEESIDEQKLQNNTDFETDEDFDLGDIGFFDRNEIEDEKDNNQISAVPQTEERTEEQKINENVTAPNIISSQTDQLVGSTFKTLTDTLSSHKSENPMNRSLGDIVNEMLKPMMQKWLDQNLPQIVEKLVKEEISRLVTKAQK